MSNFEPEANPTALRDRVRSAVFWRSGSQIVAQLITWTSTFLVIRLLDPADYGLVAMAAIVLTFLCLLEGYGFASSLIQREHITKKEIRQVFGLLILLNLSLAIAQLLIAPYAAAYFREPQVADVLRAQAVMYLTTPFIAIPFALLSRDLEYRKQAIANLVGAIVGAATALILALQGFGVWTLVYAPITGYFVRAIGLTYAARSLMWPSFSFKGAGILIGFGGAMTVTQFFWFLQSQSDVFIAGRLYGAHTLGLYTTALFLAQIFAAKFVPPLNDVAFATYSRMHREGAPLAPALEGAARLILLIALPFYIGLAITAEPLVTALLGEQWLDIIPIVRLLALAMPFMTLQILFAPATNASGKPWIAVRVNMVGAVIMATCFFFSAQFGIVGMARAWLVGIPLLTAVTMAISMPVIGIRLSAIVRAVLPGLGASLVMASIVMGLDWLLPPLPAITRLVILAATGIASYGLLLLRFARPLVNDLWDLAINRKPRALEATA